MKAIKNFIDKNYNEFSSLNSSEVCELSLTYPDLNSDIIDYLKENYRYDYKDICIYYNDDVDEIWVENNVWIY